MLFCQYIYIWNGIHAIGVKPVDVARHGARFAVLNQPHREWLFRLYLWTFLYFQVNHKLQYIYIHFPFSLPRSSHIIIYILHLILLSDVGCSLTVTERLSGWNFVGLLSLYCQLCTRSTQVSCHSCFESINNFYWKLQRVGKRLSSSGHRPLQCALKWNKFSYSISCTMEILYVQNLLGVNLYPNTESCRWRRKQVKNHM